VLSLKTRDEEKEYNVFEGFVARTSYSFLFGMYLGNVKRSSLQQSLGALLSTYNTVKVIPCIQ
jgi:hypothetical protein